MTVCCMQNSLLHTYYKYSGILFLDTLGPEGTVLIIEVSSFWGLKMLMAVWIQEPFGSTGVCPQ